MAAYENRMQNFIKKLQRRQLQGPYNSSREALQLLKIIVKCTPDFVKMEEEIKRAGNIIQMSRTSELSIGNMFRRVLKIVRDSIQELDNDEEEVDQSQHKETYTRQQIKQRIENIVQSIEELQIELQTYKNDSVEYAKEIINPQEIILTSGYSELILKTLVELTRSNGNKLNIRVVVCESYPVLSGVYMADQLRKNNIPVTLIRDTNILNIMQFVSKVLVEANTVLASGAILAAQGSNSLAQIASIYAKPFYVIVGQHQLTPLHLHDYSENLNDHLYPEQLADYDILVEPYRFYQTISEKNQEIGVQETFLELGIQYKEPLQDKDYQIISNDIQDNQSTQNGTNNTKIENGMSNQSSDNFKGQITEMDRPQTRYRDSYDDQQYLDPQLVKSTAPTIHVYNQRHDYVKENFIQLVITDLGIFIPNEIETVMLNQLYDMQDFAVDDNFQFDLHEQNQ